MASHELEDQARDLVSVLVEREVAGVQQMDFGIGWISRERLGAERSEGRIVCAPGHQCGRLVIAQPGLPLRVGGDILVR